MTTKAQIEAARKVLRNSSCFCDEVCSLLPCKCVEAALAAAAEVGCGIKAMTPTQIEAAADDLEREADNLSPSASTHPAPFMREIARRLRASTAVEVGEKADIEKMAHQYVKDELTHVQNATIERCAQAADTYPGRIGRQIAAEIRALKDIRG